MAITKNKTGRVSKNPGSETLYNLYIIQDKTAIEIAEMYGVTKTTVRGWLRKADRPTETSKRKEE